MSALHDFRAKLRGEQFMFAETLAFIAQHYQYQPSAFSNGNVQNAAGQVSVKFHDIVQGLYQRGFSLPILLRFGDLLAARLRTIHEAFSKAITESNYTGIYRGVYPIKVNQQQQVV
jgi:arginine decarboxylase-like protein